jgi:hypothetical protein
MGPGAQAKLLRDSGKAAVRRRGETTAARGLTAARRRRSGEKG